MKVILVLDVKPMDGESRREPSVVIEELESEIGGLAVDVPNGSGTFSAHEIKVLGVGKTWPETQESQTIREQANSARD